MKSINILVSIKRAEVRSLIKKIADINGWKFIRTAGANEVSRRLSGDRRISIAVLDSHACGENFSVISEAKRLNPFLRTILIADEWNLSEVRSAMNKGAFDILLQPVDFSSLSATLKKAAEQVRMTVNSAQTEKQLQILKKELEIAARIQQDILPSNTNGIDGCEIFASMIPAKEIGGDFYDFFKLNDQEIGIVIGDVSGKGIPAALFMAVCRSLLRATALQGGSTFACLSHVNKVLSEDNPTAMFVTVFYGILNVRKKQLDYCIGGHDSPFVISKDGRVRPLERTANRALGYDGEVSYQSKTVYLAEGDRIFLYTDGITEAENPARLLYGRDRLIASLRTKNGEDAEQIIRSTLKKIRSFTMGTLQSDDITAMAVTF